MANERLADAELRRILPAGAVVQRVENAVGPGTPDIFICVDRQRQAWAEAKEGVYAPTLRQVRVPKSKLRASQFAWLTAYTRRGGVGLVVVHCESLRHTFILPFQDKIWADLMEGKGTDFLFVADDAMRTALRGEKW